MENFIDHTLELGTQTESMQAVISLLKTYIDTQEVGTMPQQNVVLGALTSLSLQIEAFETDVYNRLSAVGK